MADLGQVFDGNTYQPRQSFDPLPPGDYAAQIVASEVRDAKSGNGAYLQLEFQITGGDHDGRKIWKIINLFHSNPKAVEIAHQELDEICRAIGKRAANSEDLHFIPMLISVKIKPSEGQYSARNEISKYKPASGGAVSAQPTAVRAAPATAAKPAAATPPWRKAG